MRPRERTLSVGVGGVQRGVLLSSDKLSVHLILRTLSRRLLLPKRWELVFNHLGPDFSCIYSILCCHTAVACNFILFGPDCACTGSSYYACPGGKYSSTTGLDSSTQCSTCPSGSYCPSGERQCLDCHAADPSAIL